MSYALRITKVLAFLLISVIALLCLGALYQYGAEALDNYRYPAPGKLIDVGGYKLHIRCTGSGAPSVIIAAGGGEFSLSWFAVQDEIAKFTHVCTYDRSGTGWSEEGPLPQTGKNIAMQLHALLESAGIPKPYILVGHSLGGVYVRLYANIYPNDVYGVILVDSAHELQLKRAQEFQKMREEKSKNAIQDTPNDSIIEHITHALAKSWFGQHTGIDRLYVLMTEAESFSARPVLIQDAFRARYITGASSRSGENTGKHSIETLSELENSENKLLDKPLTVIIHGKESPETQEAYAYVILPLAEDLVAKSSKGKQIIAENSGHMIHYEQPEIIVEAVRDMVAQYHKEKR